MTHRDPPPGDGPFNARPPLGLLRRSFATPQEAYFSRNHGSVVEVDPNGLRLAVGGLVERPLSLSMEDLRGGLPKAEEVWSFKGYANNSWHGVRVTAR